MGQVTLVSAFTSNIHCSVSLELAQTPKEGVISPIHDAGNKRRRSRLETWADGQYTAARAQVMKLNDEKAGLEKDEAKIEKDLEKLEATKQKLEHQKAALITKKANMDTRITDAVKEQQLWEDRLADSA